MAPNNFDYRADLDGGKCPFQAHIRKSNPRGSGPGGLPNQNSRRMVRRGITYGSRKDDFSKIADMPEGGVGLLFMAYQKSIANQFEFIQQSWVNNVGFPTPGTGIDPVLGQSAAAPPAQKWPNVWGQAASTVDFDFRDFVKMRGGEYFFAPSLSSLGRL
jgi:deferrochelatase/peroxidase EfeB